MKLYKEEVAQNTEQKCSKVTIVHGGISGKPYEWCEKKGMPVNEYTCSGCKMKPN